MAEEYKGYNIVGDGTFGMELIKTIGRGSLPNDLLGSFSTPYEARKAIDAVVSKKEAKNAKTDDTD